MKINDNLIIYIYKYLYMYSIAKNQLSVVLYFALKRVIYNHVIILFQPRKTLWLSMAMDYSSDHVRV